MVGAGQLDTYFEDSGGYFQPGLIHLVFTLLTSDSYSVLDVNTAALSQEV